MLNVAIWSVLYPKEENPYLAMYVHSRVVEYVKRGIQCTVYVLDKKNSGKKDEYEGIPVFRGDVPFLIENVREQNPDLLCMHAPSPEEKRTVVDFFPEKPVIAWIHGLDTMSGAFRYPYGGSPFLHPARFLYRLREDFRKKKSWQEMFQKMNVQMVYVSRWMRGEAHSFLKETFPKEHIIPNPIDEDLFPFRQRKGEVARLLCLRPHIRDKGADIAIKAFKESDYSLDFYGRGPLFKNNVAYAKSIDANVDFFDKFFSRKEMANLFFDYDLAIMPTRRDAQGVTVCEMLLSGLPVITSNIGHGNNEFSSRGCLFLRNDDFNVKYELDRINSRKGLLEEMSFLAHQDMMSLASKKKVIDEEVALMLQSCHGN